MGETELFENILIKCCSFIWNKRLAPSWQQKTHHYDDDINSNHYLVYTHAKLQLDTVTLIVTLALAWPMSVLITIHLDSII